MDTLTFLKKVLPSRGHYFVATLHTGKERPYFKHFHCDTVEEAAARALALDQGGENVYHACSSFREAEITVERKDPKTGELVQRRQQRVQDNVLLCKAFWLDLDVGEGARKYATQQAAIVGLAEFLKTTKIPSPLIVSSGNGLHCYWPLTEDIIPAQWTTTAKMLKEVCSHYGLLADPSRTADSASVLRPVGTFNKKNNAAKLVELVRDAAPIQFESLYRVLQDALPPGSRAEPPRQSSVQTANDPYMVPSNFAASSAERVADRCAQIRSMRDKGGDIPEPVWYAAIQVLFHTAESEQVIHAWSSGYPGYSPDETTTKINQIRGMGPTLCKTFGEKNPAGCLGCPFKGKISSPIQLGIQATKAEAPVVVANDGETVTRIEIPDPPRPFIRAKDGLYIEIEEGVQQKFYEYDVYPIEQTIDDHVGYRTATIYHALPNDGGMQFTLALHSLSTLKEFITALQKQGILKCNYKLLARYMEDYLFELQRKSKTRRLVQNMGWTPDFKAFALGKKVYNADGSIVETSLSQRFGSSAVGFRAVGDLGVWRDTTEILSRSGWEAHAFSLLLGFGAPLLKLTGHSGVMFSMLGTTSSGKSSMGKWLLTIWGRFEDLRVGQKDTPLAIIERITSFCNLPVYMDEFSKLEGEQLGTMAYQITRGEGRKRLRQDASERAAGAWSTFLVTSTNHSIQGKLDGANGNAHAEQVRVFEYAVPAKGSMDEWRTIHQTLDANYGVAGEVYAAYIAQHIGEIREGIRKVEDTIVKLAKCSGEERFWVSGVACAIFGGMLARKLGLIAFEVQPIFQWVLGQFGQLRDTVAESVLDEVTLLGAYLDEFTANRLVVGNEHNDPLKRIKPFKVPHGELYHRLELDTGKLYINQSHLRRELINRNVDYGRFKKALTSQGILVGVRRIVLGKGTEFISIQNPCWVINMRHKLLADKIEEELEQ